MACEQEEFERERCGRGLFELGDTSPLFGSLLWDRKHFYNATMSLHELCLCYPKKKARH